MRDVHVVDHPLVQHKLTLMREAERTTKGFRQLLNEIGMLLCYEVTRDLALEMIDIETPLVSMKAPVVPRNVGDPTAEPSGATIETFALQQTGLTFALIRSPALASKVSVAFWPGVVVATETAGPPGTIAAVASGGTE